MKQSKLFLKIRKEIPADADSINASYLVRAGFVKKHFAGVYALLPLGFRVYKKIENIIREEMNKIDGQEILMNVLQPKELWDETGRWNEMKDIFYRLTDARNKEIGLAPTHEEQVTDIVRHSIGSYKDLPTALYQIQTKFRNEPRAKSGLLRGREFIMKDLYSFHADEKDLDDYYEKSKIAYINVFKRFGLEAKIVEASGGVFSKYSHEFQVLTPQGEDTIYCCEACDFAQNKEIAEVAEGDDCPKCKNSKIKMANSIEVGNIFRLMTKFSEAMGANYADDKGEEKPIVMGCYGLGLTRSLATIVELHYNNEKNKMVWPKEVAPFHVHLISLGKNEEADKIYDELQKKNVETIYDDRDMSAGQKFAEADLVGCPIKVIVSNKSLENGGVEFVDEVKAITKVISTEELINIF